MSTAVSGRCAAAFYFPMKSEVLRINNQISSLVNWVGRKSALSAKIIMSFPLHYTRYAEPFGGSATILLNKPPDRFEAYNDYNSNLVNFMRCIRDKPLSFFKAAGYFPLNSRQEFNAMLDFLDRTEPDIDQFRREIEIAYKELTDDEAMQVEKILTTRAENYDVERAAVFFKTQKLSYSSTGKSFGGQPVNIRNAMNGIYQMSRRLDGVVIDNKDFESFIKLHDKPGTFMYLDPPYYNTEDFYIGFSHDDHLRLLECVSNAKYTKFLISYNDDTFIKELYKDFGTIYCLSRTHSMAQRYSAGSIYDEIIIANYDANERRKNLPYQMTFDKVLLGVIKMDYDPDILLPRANDRRPNNHTFYMTNLLAGVEESKKSV